MLGSERRAMATTCQHKGARTCAVNVAKVHRANISAADWCMPSRRRSCSCCCCCCHCRAAICDLTLSGAGIVLGVGSGSSCAAMVCTPLYMSAGACRWERRQMQPFCDAILRVYYLLPLK